MSAEKHLSPAQFYHGTSGAHEFNPGDLLTPEGGRMRHVYYTSSLETAKNYATWGGPDLENPKPGHVYEIQPETSACRKIGKHAEDSYSGLKGNESAYRTRGRLRVIREVHPEVTEAERAERDNNLRQVREDKAARARRADREPGQ